MTDKISTWDDLRRVADELELKIHLAGMEARDRWQALQPRLAELERTIARKSERTGQVVSDELASLGSAIRKLADDVSKALVN